MKRANSGKMLSFEFAKLIKLFHEVMENTFYHKNTKLMSNHRPWRNVFLEHYLVPPQQHN